MLSLAVTHHSTLAPHLASGLDRNSGDLIHTAHLYENVNFLAAEMAQHAAAGLAEAEPVLIIVRDAYRSQLELACARAGVDWECDETPKPVSVLSAEECIQRFTIAGWPDEELFHSVIASRLCLPGGMKGVERGYSANWER